LRNNSLTVEEVEKYWNRTLLRRGRFKRSVKRRESRDRIFERRRRGEHRETASDDRGGARFREVVRFHPTRGKASEK